MASRKFDDNPLTRQVRASWRLALLIVAVLAGFVAYVEFDAKRARAEARDVMQPLAEKLDAHITKTDAMIPAMQEFARDNREQMKAIRQHQYRVCLKLRLDECDQP